MAKKDTEEIEEPTLEDLEEDSEEVEAPAEEDSKEKEDSK